MALRNAFENLGLDSTLQAIRDRLPAALGGNGGVKVEQQGPVDAKLQDGLGNAIGSTAAALDVNIKSSNSASTVTANQGGVWDIRNVSGTVALPTGAATSVKQSDGSQKTQIVDGSGNVVGSTTNALDVNIKSGGGTSTVTGNVASAAADSGNPVKIGGVYNTSPLALTNGQRGDIQLNTRGHVITTLIDSVSGTDGISASPGLVRDLGGSQRALGAIGYTYNGTTLDRMRNDGTTGGQGVGGTVAAASADSGNPVKIGGKNNTTLPTYTDGQRGDLQIGTRGSLNVTIMGAGTTAGADIQSTGGDGLASKSGIATYSPAFVFNGTTYDRLRGDATNGAWVNIKSGGVSMAPAATGGLSIYRNINVGATGANIKTSAGQVYGWYLYNNASSVRYVKLYNKASAPTVGTDTPVMTIPLPANAGANVSYDQGLAFSAGIGVGATTGIADSDVGSPSANDVVVNINYF